MMRVYLLFLCLTAMAQASDSGASTVTVEQGEAELRNDHGGLRLKQGETGRLRAEGAPARIAPGPAATPTPPAATAAAVPAAPLQIAWDPPTRNLSVEDTPLTMSHSQDATGLNTQGIGAGGRFYATYSKRAGLYVEERGSATGKPLRTARLAPDGTWTHEFSGMTLVQKPDGSSRLRLADGQTVDTPAPGRPNTPDEMPRQGKLGVKLAPGEAGRLVVGAVYPGSPAEKAGFQEGDIVVEVNGRRADALETILEELRKTRPRMRVEFVVEREGRQRRLSAVSGSWSEP